ncbi:MAG TPA: aspartate 1-decarboxylase [bacterium (Candidatus Stahlbacteria)]|nr:aspartate 1-decarboxylase [Candidatus Stahlbacteria bacterium]
MDRIICKSKIHGIRVTQKNLKYEGSIEIDGYILEKADILPHEIVQVVNVNTGSRFDTYVIKGEPNSGICSLNGGAARLGEVGDPLLIISYGIMDTQACKTYQPKIVFVNENNRVIKA